MILHFVSLSDNIIMSVIMSDKSDKFGKTADISKECLVKKLHIYLYPIKNRKKGLRLFNHCDKINHCSKMISLKQFVSAETCNVPNALDQISIVFLF